MGRAADAGKFTAEVVDQVFARDGGRCASCGRGHDRKNGRGLVWSIHHREPRGSGGARHAPHIGAVENAIILCGHGTAGCHSVVERFRADGIKYGYLISRNGILRAAEVPIRHKVHGWCLLTAEGGAEPCDPPGDE